MHDSTHAPQHSRNDTHTPQHSRTATLERMVIHERVAIPMHGNTRTHGNIRTQDSTHARKHLNAGQHSRMATLERRTALMHDSTLTQDSTHAWQHSNARQHSRTTPLTLISSLTPHKPISLRHRALKSLNLASNSLGVEGTKIVAAVFLSARK
jgi:hypothetical protein